MATSLHSAKCIVGHEISKDAQAYWTNLHGGQCNKPAVPVETAK